jgi:hypothetical protein
MVHTCNFSTQNEEVLELEASLGYLVRPPSQKKPKSKINEQKKKKKEQKLNI